jgi:general nucleoside transport system ATP-binding protein
VTTETMIDATLTKRFGAREVLNEARLAVVPGTVHALVGENGAGKSTLVKIIAGVLGAEAGSLAIAGEPVALGRWNRIAARAAGIGIVQQHGASAETLTVVENAVLGVEPRRGPVLALEAVADELAALGDRIGLPVDPRARTETLSLGAAQRAEIVAALYHGARVLILDEPTAVLTPIEVDGLLATLRTLATSGTTIVFVTHKLDEVRLVADAVTVLRAGRTVATFAGTRKAAVSGRGEGEGEGAAPSAQPSAQPSALSINSSGDPDTISVRAIARAMVGSDLPDAPRVAPIAGDATIALALEAVGVGSALHDISLAIRAGELVGVAGVDGNGQRELALAIAGLVRAAGSIALGGRDLTRATPARRLASGLAHVPEDRHHGGLVLDASVAANLALGRRDVTGRWRIDRAAMRRHAEARIAELDIRPADPDAIARTLSGGNQQKVVVARELSRPGLVVVVAAQPTRGVDLGAVVRIHDRLRGAAAEGAGVLVISADLDELLGLCHRIVVLLRGRIVGELGGDALRTPDARATLGAWMTGLPGERAGSAAASRSPGP